ncbi:MAG TPA: ABC transporter ATP-binding protein [Rhodospirillales bacterium]|nr:ABC transporter ATP-binding protein [Rhodospirillales bacterium]
MNEVILQAQNLTRHYQVSQGLFADKAVLKALDGVGFSLSTGKTLAVVGESGCGKSTLARLLTMIEEPTSGRLVIDGDDVIGASAATIRKLRPMVQIVFQDPYSSLNPRQKVGSILEEPLKINTSMSAAERRRAGQEMMAKVGLRPEHYGRYPHMFSGGQRQRIAIARALMLKPKIVILDEPVSALDVSIQAQVLNLLADLQDEFNLAYLFISHDLSVVRHVADEIMVMYLGHPVEFGFRQDIFSNPRHPYTRALLSSTPKADPTGSKERIKLSGELPSPLDPPSGCPFHPRCQKATDLCGTKLPEIEEITTGHQTACHHWRGL